MQLLRLCKCKKMVHQLQWGYAPPKRGVLPLDLTGAVPQTPARTMWPLNYGPKSASISVYLQSGTKERMQTDSDAS